MPNPATQRTGLMSRRARHFVPDARSTTWIPRELLTVRAMGSRRSWVIAMRARKAIHERIVFAFAQRIEGRGPGPTDLDLRLFARLAVMEQRLKRAFDKARAQRSCAAGPAR
jgi:hypothetical protein